MLQKTQLLYEDWGKTYRERLKCYRSDLIGLAFFLLRNEIFNCCNVTVVVQLFTCFMFSSKEFYK